MRRWGIGSPIDERIVKSTRMPVFTDFERDTAYAFIDNPITAFS
jgi:hypothetical protein